MKQETVLKIKYIIDKAYDIVTVQTIGVVVFILIGLTVKFIGGDVYTNARKIYYSKTDISIDTGIVTNDENLVSSDTANEQENTSSDTTYEDTHSAEELQPSEDIIETANKSSGYIWPLDGMITARYGLQSYLFSGPDNSHTGIDIAANTGTKIKSVADGRVVFAGYSEGYGNYMIIKHSDKLSTLYAHCSQLLYKEGTEVKKGDVIALVGSTGKATGSHLHIETLIYGKSVDPLWILPPISNI